MLLFCVDAMACLCAWARAGTEQRGLRVKGEEAGEYMVCGCVGEKWSREGDVVVGFTT